MDRGPVLAEEHDSLLQQLPSTTGHPLAHWLGLLEKGGGDRLGFLAALELLRDQLGIPHVQASAIVWAHTHPHMVPADLRPRGAPVTLVPAEPLAATLDDADDDDAIEAKPAAAPAVKVTAKPKTKAKANVARPAPVRPAASRMPVVMKKPVAKKSKAARVAPAKASVKTLRKPAKKGAKGTARLAKPKATAAKGKAGKSTARKGRRK